MKKLLWLFLLAVPAFAQDLRYDSVAQGPRGPVAGATVAICSQPANTSTTPCSPLANLCSGLTDVVCSQPNPITADQLGNYHFYMNPNQGPVTVQIYGPSVAAPYVLQDQFASSQVTGSNTWTGPNTFTGPSTFSGNTSITGGQNTGTFYSLNNILFVDGVKFANIAAAIAALPSTGGEVWTPPNYSETITSGLVIGGTALLNTKPVTLRLGRGTILTLNVTSGACGITVANDSSIVGDGTVGANGSFQGGAVIQVASTANMSAAICNGDVSTGQEYFALEHLMVNDNASATISGALVDLQAVFVPSYIRDSILLPAGHIGLRYRGNTSGLGFGPFACDNCWINGQAVAGSQPVVIQSTASSGIMNGLNFIGGAIEHAGTGQFEVTVDNTAGPSAAIDGVNFYGTYCENSFAASSCFKFRDTVNWALYDVSVDGIAGADIVNISQSAGSRAGVGSIVGMHDHSGYTNLVNDTVRSTTIASPANNGTLPFYSFANPAFAVAPSTFTNNVSMPVLQLPEQAAPSGVSGSEICYGDSTAHAVECSYNNGTFFKVPQVVGSGTATMTVAAITAGNCGATVTVAASGVASTDTITWAFNAAPAGSNAGLVAWPTANNVNFAYCPNTAETPAAATINWRVVR